MKHRIFLAAIIFAASGCATAPTSGDQTMPTNPATTTVAATTLTTTTATPQPSTYRIGEQATGGCSGSTCSLTFTITKVTDCTGGYAGDPPPANTTRKLLWVEVQTGPDFDVSQLPSSAFTQFTSISSSGVTGGVINPSTFWECAPKGSGIGMGDENWLPNKKYAGAIEVYLPNDAVMVANANGYWEWQIR